MEILMDASNGRAGPFSNQTAVGNGTFWQMVCNLQKSRLGGIGVGGLLEGEPRSSPQARPQTGIFRAAIRAGPGCSCKLDV